MNQHTAPLAEALAQQILNEYIPFDVPGHKGRLQELRDYYGQRCVLLDKNSRGSIDYLCQPRSVIREAEQLAAAAFGARDAFFMVGGTTSSVQAMIMAACNPGDKIILPRNVHFSVINAVILAGAIPVYIEPAVHPKLGIALGVQMDDVALCIQQNRDAKAIFVNNPTYYGICSNLEGITRMAHAHQMLVLADEAHGTHFYFNHKLPRAAMHCGVDLSAISMHKTGGSLTQSSILLSNGALDREIINNTINLMRTTSASYLLLSSLDLARRNLALQGGPLLDMVLLNATQARDQINTIGGYYAFSSEIVDGDAVANFDQTKLSIHTSEIGLSGIEVYALLRDEYHIQIEFGDMRNILALCSLGDRCEDLELLADALRKIKKRHRPHGLNCPVYEYVTPDIVFAPREAFYAPKQRLHISQCANRICADFVMSYPPGIPLLAPGERITRNIIDHILFAAEKGCSISGLMENSTLLVIQ